MTESPDDTASLRRAAEYVRMSTEHQKYSSENLSDAIRAYAASHGMEIVRTYADAGKSGLRIEGREALQKLIRDVEEGRAGFRMPTNLLITSTSASGQTRGSPRERGTVPYPMASLVPLRFIPA